MTDFYQVKAASFNYDYCDSVVCSLAVKLGRTSSTHYKMPYERAGRTKNWVTFRLRKVCWYYRIHASVCEFLGQNFEAIESNK